MRMNKFVKDIAIVLTLGLMLVGCTTGAHLEHIEGAHYNEIPESVLKNGSYIVDGQTVKLTNGVAEKKLPGSAAKITTKYFGAALKLDMNGDGLLDSAFLLQQETGGSGTFFFVVAAINTKTGYRPTKALFLGDRIVPQSISIDPRNPRQFIVDYLDRKPGEPMASAPSVLVSKRIALKNGALGEVK